ncbi:hypothetical protein, partial [Spiroplasma sp. hyd1]|uniref:hypothetical protein n=1 Tax=Spiroplasma sp. hyd1 TaxID=1609976 RepID=UPI001E582085
IFNISIYNYRFFSFLSKAKISKKTKKQEFLLAFKIIWTDTSKIFFTRKKEYHITDILIFLKIVLCFKRGNC